MSTRRVKFVADLDTGNMEKELDRVAKKRRGGGGGGGGGGAGGFGAGMAAGRGGGLGGVAKAGAIGAAGAALGTALVGGVLPGGFKTLADTVKAATSEIAAFKDAVGASSPARDAVIGTQARDATISQLESTLGRAGGQISTPQLTGLYDQFNRLNRQELEGQRSVRERLSYYSGGAVTQWVADINSDIARAAGLKGSPHR